MELSETPQNNLKTTDPAQSSQFSLGALRTVGSAGWKRNHPGAGHSLWLSHRGARAGGQGGGSLTCPGSGHCGNPATPQTPRACRPHPPPRAARAWGRRQRRESLVIGQMHPLHVRGSDCETQRTLSSPGLSNLFHPGTTCFAPIFQTHRKPHTQSP